ncbi:hypothetical protein GYA49_02245 [Candidatus Beckwithbacteria bacterium]|nr:hypothetical protein [Candidatus Beckwithbacteria bacterium]
MKLTAQPLANYTLLIVLAIVVTIIFTWNFSTHIFSYYTDDGDYVLSASISWYVQNAIKTGKIFHQTDFFNGYQFYPQPLTLAYSDHRLFYGLLLLPIYPLVTSLGTAMNLVQFVSIVGTLLAAYVTFVYFLKSKVASGIASLVYTFNPLFYAHFPQHLDFTNRALLPLLFLTAYKYIQKPSWKRSGVFTLTLILSSFTAVYFFSFSLLVLPIFIAPLLWKKWKDKKYLIKLGTTSLLILLSLPIIFYIYQPYGQFSRQEMIERTIGQNIFFSARLIDWISPHPQNWLYGSLAQKLDPYRAPKDQNGIFNYEEHTMFLNLMPMLLFGIAFVVSLGKFKQLSFKSKTTYIAFGLVLGLAFILTFGPYSQWWNSFASTALPLPFFYLRKIIPLLSGIRVTSRFQFLFYLPFALGVGYGLKIILQYLPAKVMKVGFIVAVVSLLLLENWNTKTYQDNSYILKQLPNKQLQFLRNKSVLHYPTKIHDLGSESNYYLNWLTQTGEKTVNGNSGYLPADHIKLLENLEANLDEAALTKLKALTVDYVIIHQDLLATREQQAMIAANKNLYQNLVIWENNNLQILDLHKLAVQPKLCDWQSLNKNLQLATVKNYPKQIYVLFLKNSQDCYVVSPFEQKYQSLAFTTYDLFGQEIERHVQLRLPAILEPDQEIMLSELTNDLKIY